MRFYSLVLYLVNSIRELKKTIWLTKGILQFSDIEIVGAVILKLKSNMGWERGSRVG